MLFIVFSSLIGDPGHDMRFESLGFPHSYSCSVLEDPPTDGTEVLRFGYNPNFRSDASELILRIVPAHAEAWVGTFSPQFAYFLTGIYACPSEAHLLVVNGGAAYIVNASDPEDYSTVAGAIIGVARVPDRPVLLIWDEQNMSAYDASGLLWWIESLAEEDLCIKRLTSTHIFGTVADLLHNAVREITIDVSGGEVSGAWVRHSASGVGYPRVHRRRM